MEYLNAISLTNRVYKQAVQNGSQYLKMILLHYYNMTKKSNLKIGDVFEIPLSDGRKAYGQYVHDNMGSIIRIFSYFISYNDKSDISKINTSDLLFPPVHAGVYAAIKRGTWKIIGKLPTDDLRGF